MNTGLTIHDQASATDSAWRECGIPINVPAKTMCLVVDTFVLNLDLFSPRMHAQQGL